ncbi:hypothetical protein P3G55_21950 [Leptospira sp. 96542]|nr:hypothetical protein [Leptospira sp. 96542]
MDTSPAFAARVIAALGGPTAAAKKFQIHARAEAGQWPPQRVSNWLRRGMPPRVLLDFQEVIEGALCAINANVGPVTDQQVKEAAHG